MENMLSMLLDGAVDTLDISPHLQRKAVERYEEVGSWLAENGGDRVDIYPQGSFRLGTVVRPNTRTGEYDIDLVFRLMIEKESTTQAGLKERVGDLLNDYMRWKKKQRDTNGPKRCEQRRRCWTLEYPDHGFHLDVLPAIPDTEHEPTGILLTDRELFKWQHSNPIGYAIWFRERSEELRGLLLKRAAERHMNVADVPEFEVRSTLQRAVQILKWHCMLRFATDPDNRPPSILITTLAAHAYRGETDLFAATRSVLANMLDFIENRDGIWWVPNPAHKGENFTDKWNEYPERREAFLAWHKSISSVLNELVRLESSGIHVVAAELTKSFSADAVQRSVERYGQWMTDHRRAGTVRMGASGILTAAATGTRLRDHTFHGQHPRG